ASSLPTSPHQSRRIGHSCGESRPRVVSPECDWARTSTDHSTSSMTPVDRAFRANTEISAPPESTTRFGWRLILLRQHEGHERCCLSASLVFSKLLCDVAQCLILSGSPAQTPADATQYHGSAHRSIGLGRGRDGLGGGPTVRG